MKVIKIIFVLVSILFFQSANLLAIEIGSASYYADKFVGKKTSSGELYSHEKMTCAHRTLPFGTILKVTCIKNGKSVFVKVNDRGPFKIGRVVDLSKRAAQKLGLIQWGHAEVEVEQINEMNLEEEVSEEMIAEVSNPLEKPKNEISNLHKMNMQDANVKGWAIQIGSFTTHDGLMNMYETLSNRYKNAAFFKNVNIGDKIYFRMYIASFNDKDEALQEFERIKEFIENPLLVQL